MMTYQEAYYIYKIALCEVPVDLEAIAEAEAILLDAYWRSLRYKECQGDVNAPLCPNCIQKRDLAIHLTWDEEGGCGWYCLRCGWYDEDVDYPEPQDYRPRRLPWL